MYLPVELQYMILSFVPYSKLRIICKDWDEEVKNIQSTSVTTISKWFRLKRVNDEYNDVRSLIRYYVIHYPDEYFLKYPEFTVRKLGLNPELLILPNLKNRKRSDVRDWMMNIPISFSDWIFVGW